MIQLDGTILRIGAGAYPFCHHLQELLDYPNLFLPDPVELACILPDGTRRMVSARVYRPGHPFVFFREGNDQARPVATNLVDFPYLHRGERERSVRGRPELAPILARDLVLRTEAEREGRLESGALNGCECDLFGIRSSMEYAMAEGRQLLDQYPALYTADSMAAATGVIWS